MPKNDPYAELLLLCAEGDEQAFSRLYKMTSPKLYSVCFRLMRTRQAAEEVLQEGFVKIWRNAGSFDRSRASAMTWMSTVVRNRALDVLRSLKSRPQEIDMEYEGLEFASGDLSPDDGAGLSWSADRVVNCMKQLQENQRKAIFLAYYYGHTHEEISRKLQSPLGTVKAWVRRGVERLRTCLE